jgi:hypothetical protein
MLGSCHAVWRWAINAFAEIEDVYRSLSRWLSHQQVFQPAALLNPVVTYQALDHSQ